VHERWGISEAPPEPEPVVLDLTEPKPKPRRERPLVAAGREKS
jgi:hypothetical protein